MGDRTERHSMRKSRETDQDAHHTGNKIRALKDRVRDIGEHQQGTSGNRFRSKIYQEGPHAALDDKPGDENRTTGEETSQVHPDI